MSRNVLLYTYSAMLAGVWVFDKLGLTALDSSDPMTFITITLFFIAVVVAEIGDTVFDED